MSLEDINKIINNETSDREYRQKIKILKYVYTMLLDDGDLNKTSMILYSGPQEDRPCYNFLSLQPAFSLFPRRSCLFDTFYNKEKTGIAKQLFLHTPTNYALSTATTKQYN